MRITSILLMCFAILCTGCAENYEDWTLEELERGILILSVFGVFVIIVFVLSMATTQTCPHCKQRINASASVCPRCTRDIEIDDDT